MDDDAKQLIDEFRAQFPSARNFTAAELLERFKNLNSLPPHGKRRITSKLSRTDAVIMDVKDSPEYKDIRDRADNLTQRQPQFNLYGTVEALLVSIRHHRAVQRKSLGEINGSGVDLQNVTLTRGSAASDAESSIVASDTENRPQRQRATVRFRSPLVSESNSSLSVGSTRPKVPSIQGAPAKKDPLPSFIEERDVVSELLYALNGERNRLMLESGDGNRLVLSELANEVLSTKQLFEAQRTAVVASHVRVIEGARAMHQAGKLSSADSMKLAFYSSILASYRQYSDEVETLVSNHAGGTAVMTLAKLAEFVAEWDRRIVYLANLIVTAKTEVGCALMNILYEEWLRRSAYEWIYQALENALDDMSVALHALMTEWLLDGHAKNETWLIRSTRNKDRDNWFMSGELVVHLIPTSLRSSEEILEKIIRVGQDVHFAKKARKAFYDHRLEERKRIVESVNARKLWYCWTQRNSLRNMLDSLSQIVAQDLLKEFLQVHRFADHLTVLQRHFFVSHGSFVCSLNIARRRVLDGDHSGAGSMMERAVTCVDMALRSSRSLADFPEVARYIQGTHKGSGPKANREQTDDVFDSLLHLAYRPPQPIASILTREVVKNYAEIFDLICPLRMLRLDLDEATLRLGAVMSIASNGYEDIVPTLRQMSGTLHAMRQFVSRITMYFVETVIRNECRKLDGDLAAAANVHEVQQMHSAYLASIRHACFLTEQGAALSAALQSITRLIRNYVSAIEKFFATWDDEAVRDWELERKCIDEGARVDPTVVDAVLGPARSEFCQLVIDAYAQEIEEGTEKFLVKVNDLRENLKKMLRQPDCSSYSHLLLTCIRSLYT